MTPERLAEIEALARKEIGLLLLGGSVVSEIPDLCQALREAWEEIERVKGFTIRLGDAVDETLLRENILADPKRWEVLSEAALLTEEWASIGEDRR